MSVKEYLKAIGVSEGSCINLTFNVATVDGDKHDMMYRGTPIRTVWEWQNAPVMDYVVLNTKTYQPAWLSGVDWNGEIERNQIMSLLVVSEDELLKYYREDRAMEVVKFINAKIMAEIKEGRNPWMSK